MQRVRGVFHNCPFEGRIVKTIRDAGNGHRSASAGINITVRLDSKLPGYLGKHCVRNTSTEVLFLTGWSSSKQYSWGHCSIVAPQATRPTGPCIVSPFIYRQSTDYLQRLYRFVSVRRSETDLLRFEKLANQSLPIALNQVQKQLTEQDRNDRAQIVSLITSYLNQLKKVA